MKFGLPACSALAAVCVMSWTAVASSLVAVPIAEIETAKVKYPACAILTVEEATSVLPAPATAVFPSHSIEDNWSCTFLTGAPGSYAGIEITVIDLLTPEEARKAYEEETQPGEDGSAPAPVQGLGDAAYRDTDPDARGALVFIKGRYYVSAANGYTADPGFAAPSDAITAEKLLAAAMLADAHFAERFKATAN